MLEVFLSPTHPFFLFNLLSFFSSRRLPVSFHIGIWLEYPFTSPCNHASLVRSPPPRAIQPHNFTPLESSVFVPLFPPAHPTNGISDCCFACDPRIQSSSIYCIFLPPLSPAEASPPFDPRPTPPHNQCQLVPSSLVLPPSPPTLPPFFVIAANNPLCALSCVLTPPFVQTIHPPRSSSPSHQEGSWTTRICVDPFLFHLPK